MKVWRFYKKPETDSSEIPPNVSITDKYPLYAITCDKKLAKRFIRERNQDKFILRMDDDVDKSDYAEFANMNRSTVLDIYIIDTNDEKGKAVSVEVLMTMNEYQYVEETMSFPLFDETWWYDMPTPILFNKSICKALRVLGYTQAYKLYVSTMPGANLLLDLDDEDDDYSAPPWMLDELSYFINIFSDLFV